MRKIFIIGDLHSNFMWLENQLYNFNGGDVIFVGDIQFHFQNNEWLAWFKTFNDELVKRDIQMYGIRGNHDNNSYGLEQKYTFSNFQLVKDYTDLNLKYNILCVGGAVSIDRKLQSYYRKDEEFVYDEEFCKNIRNVDIVITHSAPDYCFPRGYDTKFLQNYYNIDSKLRSDLVSERLTINKMFDVLKTNNEVKYWFSGHFHSSKTENIFGTTYKLLNICEVYELI